MSFSGIEVRERDSYCTMPNAKRTKPITPASHETLMNILEALPGSLFFVDDATTIVYANASASHDRRSHTRGFMWPDIVELRSPTGEYVTLPSCPEGQTDPRTNRSGVCFSHHQHLAARAYRSDRWGVHVAVP